MLNPSTPRVWNPKETFTLIRLWKAFPCLWMKSNKDYRNKKKKEAAVRKIADSLDIPQHEIIRKSHNLRCGMNTELRKARAKAARGLPYESSWAYYKALMFIADEVPKPKINYSGEESGSSQSGEGSGWPTIAARFGNFSAGEQDGVFPQPMDLNGDLFESLVESEGMHRFAQADYDNGNGTMGVVDDDDLIEEDNGQESNAPVDSVPNQTSQSDDDDVQEIPEPAVTLAIESTVSLTPQAMQDMYRTHAVKSKPTPAIKHCPDDVPHAESYKIFGKYITSELTLMRNCALRRRFKAMVQRVITDTCQEDDTEHCLSTGIAITSECSHRLHFTKSSLESEEDQTPFGNFVATRLKEIRSDERRRRLKRTIQKFLIDILEEDDMDFEYAIADDA